MRQFFESFLFYQLITCRFSPVERVIRYHPELSSSKKQQKFGAFIVLFLVTLIYQLFTLIHFKTPNFYETLSLPNQFVSQEDIQAAYDQIMLQKQLDQAEWNEYQQSQNQKSTDNKKEDFSATNIQLDTENKHIHKAYNCLMSLDCRNEYTRFGSTIQLNDMHEDYKFDWRLGLTIAFYVVFAFCHASLATVQQKPGLRVGMGLGIMFCMTEVRLLQDTSAQILEAMPGDRNLARFYQIFPSSWCVFESIVVARTVFFFMFSCICANSQVFEVNESELKIYYGNKLLGQQRRINITLQNLANMQHKRNPKAGGTPLNLPKEMFKPEYRQMGEHHVRDLDEKIHQAKLDCTPPTVASKYAPYIRKAKLWVSYAVTAAIVFKEILPRMYGFY